MPDIITVLVKKRKLITGLTIAATLLALIISLLRPKEYLATVTALPANSVIGDKARIFNTNIEGLYSELGSPDDLDRIEGTSKLDTIYLSVASAYNLADHYEISTNAPAGLYKAASQLKKAADIRRSAYGELKIKVWDKNPAMAAQLANALLQKLNDVHQHIHSINNTSVLQQLKEVLTKKQNGLDSLEQSIISFRTGNGTYNLNQPTSFSDTSSQRSGTRPIPVAAQQAALLEQVKEYQKLINQYELALETTPQSLIVVENARPPLRPDKPRLFQTVLFAFGASLLFSFLLAVFAESRNGKA